MLARLQIVNSLIICSLTLLFLSGCGGEPQVSFKSDGVTQTFTAGKSAIPKEFAALIYPDALATGSVSADGENEEQSKFLMLSSKSSLATVSQWYQDQLKAQLWKPDKVQEMPKLISISGHKDNLEINVMIAEDGGKTTISLSSGKQSDTNTDEKESTENYTPDKANPPTD